LQNPDEVEYIPGNWNIVVKESLDDEKSDVEVDPDALDVRLAANSRNSHRKEDDSDFSLGFSQIWKG
jgi:hypothetical protein